MFQSTSNIIYEVQIYPEHIKGYELELFEYIFGFQINIGEHFCNPFRDDRSAGAAVKEYGDKLIFQDITGWSGYDAFNLLSKVKGRNNFYKELNYFWYEYLGKKSIPIVTSIRKKKHQSEFQLKYTPIHYNDETLEYWHKYNINKEYLEDDLVYPIKEYWYTSNGIWKYIKVKERCYAIPLHGKTKLYFVDRNKTKRFITDFKSGWSLTKHEYNDNSFLIGCTSFKDMASIECNTDFQAVFLKLGENYIPTAKESEHISLYIGDNDKAGINYAKSFSQKTNIPYCIPEIKGYDVADVVASGNIDYLIHLINSNYEKVISKVA